MLNQPAGEKIKTAANKHKATQKITNIRITPLERPEYKTTADVLVGW